jgi:hypothetical protein
MVIDGEAETDLCCCDHSIFEPSQCRKIHTKVLFVISTARFTMAQRVTLRKRNPYNTTSNKRRVVKTPGGRLVYHHIKKLATAPKCGDCGIALPGVRYSIPWAIKF